MCSVSPVVLTLIQCAFLIYTSKIVTLGRSCQCSTYNDIQCPVGMKFGAGGLQMGCNAYSTSVAQFGTAHLCPIKFTILLDFRT